MPRVITIERTIYKLDELSEKAKRKARDVALERATYSDWWKCIYEDVERVGDCLGIEIARYRDSLNIDFDLEYTWIMIQLRYQYEPDAVRKIAEYAPNDLDLRDLAADFTTLQHACRLTTGGRLCATSTKRVTSSSYQVDVVDTVGEVWATDHQEEALTALLKRFNEWVFRRLYEEYAYLTSDEHLDDILLDEEFDENGSMI